MKFTSEVTPIGGFDPLRAIIEKNGAENQIIKAVEELGELSQALCKYVLNGGNEAIIDHIAEEYTDVSIMMEQLMIIFKDKAIFSEQLPKYRQAKIDRIHKLIGR